MMSKMTSLLKNSLGSIQHSTNSRNLVQALNENKLIGSSDGSLVTEGSSQWGSHAYSLRSWDNDEGKIIGKAPTPSTTKMTSLTTEIYGLLSTTILLYSITKFYKKEIQENKCVTIFCDNEQATKMYNDTNQAINITETNIPEYDIKLLIQKITNLIPVQVHFQWIKGHQNELNNGERIHGPFPRLVQTNIEMDTKAAEAILIAKSIQIKRPTYCTTQLGLYNKNNEFVYDIREQLLYNNRYNDLWTYLKDKNKWEEDQMK